jgi:hypothetical protein
MLFLLRKKSHISLQNNILCIFCENKFKLNIKYNKVERKKKWSCLKTNTLDIRGFKNNRCSPGSQETYVEGFTEFCLTLIIDPYEISNL